MYRTRTAVIDVPAMLGIPESIVKKVSIRESIKLLWESRGGGEELVYGLLGIIMSVFRCVLVYRYQ